MRVFVWNFMNLFFFLILMYVKRDLNFKVFEDICLLYFGWFKIFFIWYFIFFEFFLNFFGYFMLICLVLVFFFFVCRWFIGWIFLFFIFFFWIGSILVGYWKEYLFFFVRWNLLFKFLCICFLKFLE